MLTQRLPRAAAEFPHLKSRMPTLWSSSYIAVSVSAVSAATVEKHINTQWERPWKKEARS
jgi:putative transposase